MWDFSTSPRVRSENSGGKHDRNSIDEPNLNQSTLGTADFLGVLVQQNVHL